MELWGTKRWRPTYAATATVVVLVVLASLAGCDLGEDPVAYAAPGARLFAGDLDGDGDVDLITGGGDLWTTLLNDGTGTFTATVHDDHVNFTKMVLLDADGDGAGGLDMVNFADFPGDPPAVPAAGRLLLRRSNGDGTWADPVEVAETAPSAPGDQATIAATTGDVDGDGHLDVVLYRSEPGTAGTAEVFRWTGPGTFAPPVVSVSTAPVVTHGQLDARSTATADVTGDGRLDLVVAGTGAWPGDPDARGQIAVLAGNGTGAFTSSTAYATPAGASNRAIGPAIGDFDEDGRLDIAVADTRIDNGPETVTLWKGTAAGTLAAPVTLAGKGQHDTELVAGDVDGDGHLDLVTAACNFNDEATGSGWLMEGDGDGHIASTTELNASVPHDQEHGGVVVADFDGDHRLDVAIGNGAGTLTVFRNRLAA